MSQSSNGFVPRKEFVRELKSAPNSFAIVAIASSNFVRLYSFPPSVVATLRTLLDNYAILTAFREDVHQNLCEFVLDGKPWASPKSVKSEKLLIDILAIIYHCGYIYLSSLDYGRENDDRLAMAFSKPLTTSAGSRSATPLPTSASPFRDSSASISSDKHKTKRVPFALSFLSPTLMRVIAPPLHLTPAILQAVRASWPRGVVSEKKVGDNSFEFKLKGYKWFQQDTFATDSLRQILALLSSLDAQSFTLLSSISLTNRSRFKDLWVFTGPGSNSTDDLVRQDSSAPSALSGSHGDIKRHAQSLEFSGLQQSGSTPGSYSQHRRLATEPNSAVAQPYTPQHVRAATEDGTGFQFTHGYRSHPHFATDSQMSQSPALLRKPAPRAQVPVSVVHEMDSSTMEAIRTNLPSMISSGVEDMTGVGATGFSPDVFHTASPLGNSETPAVPVSPAAQAPANASSKHRSITPPNRPRSPLRPVSTRTKTPPLLTSSVPPPAQSPPALGQDADAPTLQLLGPGAFRDSAFSSTSDTSYNVPIKWTGIGEALAQDQAAKLGENESSSTPTNERASSLGPMLPGAWQPTPIDEKHEDTDGDMASPTFEEKHGGPKTPIHEVTSRVASPELTRPDMHLRKSEAALVGLIAETTPHPLPSMAKGTGVDSPSLGSGKGWVLVNIDGADAAPQPSGIACPSTELSHPAVEHTMPTSQAKAIVIMDAVDTKNKSRTTGQDSPDPASPFKKRFFATCPFLCRFPHHLPPSFLPPPRSFLSLPPISPRPLCPFPVPSPPRFSFYSILLPSEPHSPLLSPFSLALSMPTCRRKRVVLTEPSEALLQAARSDPTREVFYLQETGEIFETYEAYAARMSFYRLKQFQCEVTGKSGLDYFQAVESEKQEARTMQHRFSEPLKPAVLKAVQWQVMGRLDHLVEAVYERFKDRYFKGERVVVDLSGTKYYARVEKVYPPKYSSDVGARDAHKESSSSSTSSLEDDAPHVIGGDLKVPTKDANVQDNPTLYFYWVHILELEKDKSHDKKQGGSKGTEKDGKMVGSLMEVQCGMMSRDRLSFSKSILRRFIRDCVDREAAVASPWTVKPAIAKRYGLESIMPEETRKGVETIKKGEIDKRKKIWEDKEGPPAKRQKKMTPAQEERAEKREREAREKLEKQKQVKEEAERLAAEKKKKKPIRYPTEDLDVRLGEKDKKAGMKVQRPHASRVIPFNDTPGTFEAFLMGWNFLVVYGQPLHLSTFTLDEYEHAIRHSVTDPSCALLAEIHSTLIYNLRTVAFQRHSALVSLIRVHEELQQDDDSDDPLFGIPFDELTAAMADVGNNWERVPLRHTEGREGWEDALVGCLKDHATVANFPRLREVLTRLLFAPESSAETSSPSSSSSRVSTPVSFSLSQRATPAERYYSLPPHDKIAILSFMCNMAISSKAIHAHMESCEEQLTALRKEKIDVNRLKKQFLEEMSTLKEEAKEDPAAKNGIDQDVVMQDSSDLSDVSEGGSETPSTSNGGKKNSARQKELRLKAATTAHAKQREAARAKQASIKQALSEHRRLDEEVNKLERRLEGIEREFRKLLGAVRVKPLGKDRFYNRIWWFDGMGSASLVGSGGVAQYGTGRLFIQGPSEFDMDLLALRKDEDIEGRRKEEEGVTGVLGSGDWAVYSDLEELDEFVAWLNTKGHREIALKTALTKWWTHITAGIRRRIADVNVNARLPEARRSARTKSGYDVTREPYMMWTNRRALSEQLIFSSDQLCGDVRLQARQKVEGTTTGGRVPLVKRFDESPISSQAMAHEKNSQLFNSIAILLGIGMLSEPLAFAYSGWATGTFLIICYGFVSCYTAKILARIILDDPRLRSYADIGRKAFGPSSMLFISIMFCLELFAVSVILVTLYADSLHTLIPRYSTATFKLWGLVLFLPTVFLPLSLLSYTSILGIISSVLIILVVVIDGFSKPDAPGSFWSPAETSYGVESWNSLGLAFGLFMAGFSGHAVIPSLARDMADPNQFDRMINWAFIVATSLYALIGYAGYLMFGKYVSAEISIDLMQTPGYNATLNKIALWMLVISPLSKFALTTQPLNATIEILLGINTHLAAPEEMASKSNGLTIVPRGSHAALRRTFAVFQRVSMMAFLGSFSAFMLCVIGPISAKVMLAGRCSLLDGTFLAVGVIMAVWGTLAAFLAL
ncbi:hypothetical protein D9615_005253 [Tricholomella constricta]|uniref:Uncharacterized protein n=1 Tax=Tricholomella constricta TaxID=117010 RepID=A0A8H5M1Q6_9AGAR|nr:hypothetical protein D9615_005253 [Tricholomella constricta]